MKTPATYSGKVLGLFAREIGPEYVCKNVPQPPAAGQAAHMFKPCAPYGFRNATAFPEKFHIHDAKGRCVASCITERYSAFIVTTLNSHAELVAALELDAASKLGADEALPLFRKHGYTGKPNGAEMSPWIREFKRTALAAAKQA